MQISNVIKNKVVLYLTTRYLTYCIQFIIGLIIAGKLGPFYMGIYGFLQLILMYFTNINFGINSSLNILLVQHKTEEELCNRYTANSFIIVGWLSVVVMLLWLLSNFVMPKFFVRYNADKYFLWLCVIGILQYINNVIMAVVRIRNLLNLLAFMQSFNVALQFLCVLILSGEALINGLVACHIVSNIIILCMAHVSRIIPRLRYFNFDIKLQKEIFKKGLYLFIYNSCFYFIIISIRTIISDFYSVEEFGIFTFSYTLGNSLMLLASAISFIIFPKLIDRLSADSQLVIDKTLKDIKVAYATSCHFLVYLALPLFPILLLLFPKYADGLVAMNLIALTVVITTNTMGYSTMLMARNKEKTTAFISTFSLVINIVIALLLVLVFKVGFTYVIIATMITYVVLSILVVYFALRATHPSNLFAVISRAFPIKLFIPYLIAFTLTVLDKPHLIWIPLVVFLVLNNQEMKTILFVYIKRMIVKPDVVNL